MFAIERFQVIQYTVCGNLSMNNGENEFSSHIEGFVYESHEAYLSHKQCQSVHGFMESTHTLKMFSVEPSTTNKTQTANKSNNKRFIFICLLADRVLFSSFGSSTAFKRFVASKLMHRLRVRRPLKQSISKEINCVEHVPPNYQVFYATAN